MKLWKGRFTKDVDAQVNDFNASIAFDSRLYREDIEGSMAHAAMLTACGILTPAEGEALTAELETLRSEIESGAVQIDPAAEDIHTFIEETLTKRLCAAGKKLHTARSRNDQVATDFKLWTRKAAENLQELTASFVETLLNIAEANRETVMAGYTHLQRAQPVTFAHVMLCADVPARYRPAERRRGAHGHLSAGQRRAGVDDVSDRPRHDGCTPRLCKAV